MTFSDAVAQQRVKQALLLKQFLLSGLLGSVALHGMGLYLRVTNYEVSEEPLPSEITIVVTDAPQTLPEEVPEEPLPLDEPVPDPAISEEPAIVEEAAPSEVAVVETIDPVDSPEPLVDESSSAPITDTPMTSASGETAVDDRLGRLSELLEGVQRARGDQPVRAATNFGFLGRPQPGSAGEGAGDRPTDGGTSDRPSSRSREITCRDCEFDYPDSADGAEGSAQVVVETDDQGRVVSVTLSRSSGNAELDRAALEQARERVRLDGARAGESYPIEIDFVQFGSDAERRARDQGTRESITVSEPVPADSASDVGVELNTIMPDEIDNVGDIDNVDTPEDAVLDVSSDDTIEAEEHTTPIPAPPAIDEPLNENADPLPEPAQDLESGGGLENLEVIESVPEDSVEDDLGSMP